jgi:hypothetical protein
MKPQRVAVLGPFSDSNSLAYMQAGLRLCDLIAQTGNTPILILETDPQRVIEWFAVCNKVVRYPGEAPFCDRVLYTAKRLEKPIFFTEQELLAALEAEDLTDGVRVA